jgi:phage terminase large subunit-like protein
VSPSALVTAPFEIDVEALQALPPEVREEELAKVAILKAAMESNPLFRFVPHLGELGWKRREQEKVREGWSVDGWQLLDELRARNPADGLTLGMPLELQIHGDESRGQVEFLEAEQPIAAYTAGNRSGKTEIGSVWCLLQTLPDEFVPWWLEGYKLWPGDQEMHVRVIGVDLGNWLEKALLPKLRKLIPPAALYKGDFDKAYTERTRKLRFADGSWWDFLTHDMDVDSYASADLDIAWFDEEPPGEKGKQQYEETLGRLADRDGFVRWTLTPLLGLTFVYHALRDAHGNPRDDDEVKVVLGDIDHNPHISERGRDRFLKRFAKDPLKLAARKSGRWVHFAGLIYSEFSQKRHIVPVRPIPRKDRKAAPLVPIYASIDPGINEDHQAALVFAWLDQRDVLEAFWTWKSPDTTVENVAKIYHAACEELGFRPRWTTIDPAAQNRNHVTGRNVQFEYARHGIATVPGQNSRMAGFNAVKERLLSDRLVVQASCEDLINEFEEYRWKSPRGRAEDAPKPEPIKRNDDLLDALRYLVMGLPQKAKAEAEEEEVSEATRAFRHSLKRLSRRHRRRAPVGGVVPR